MAVQDLYVVLGVPRDASASAIRRAYKERCLRVHPDKQPEGAARAAAEARFKELAAAYSTLSDTAARACHDAELSREEPNPFNDESFARRFASSFEKKMREDSVNGQAPLNGEELFDALFGERRANFRFGSQSDRSSSSHTQTTGNDAGRAKPADKEVELELTLEELHTGCVKRRRVHRMASSEDEEGGYKRVATVMRIDVKPGYRPGDKVRFRGAGDESASFRAPDVVFVIGQKAHSHFTRTGDDITYILRVPLAESLTGVKAHVEGIDGARIDVQLDAVVKPGTTHVVRGAGLTRRGDPSSRGDLIVKIAVVFPEDLLSNEQAALRDVFAKIAARTEGGSKNSKPSMRRSASLFMNRREQRNAADFSNINESKSTGAGDWANSVHSAPAAADLPAHARYSAAARSSSSARRKDADTKTSPTKSASPRSRAKGIGRLGAFFR